MNVNITAVMICILFFTALVGAANPVFTNPIRTQRIVALSPHAVELLFSLGVGDRIVATTEYADFPEAALQIPRVGGYHGISLERILELQPDLVIVWKGGNSDSDIKRLKKMGLNVYESYPEKLEQVGDELLQLGLLVGKGKRARELSERFYQRLKKLRRIYGARQPVRFFYQIWAQPLRAMAAGSWINELASGCGGVNVLDSTYPDYPEVSLESILLLEPAAILQPTQHGADLLVGVNWQDWPEIPAVKNQHIYQINGDILHRFSLRILDGMEVVCERLDRVRKQ